LPGLKAPHPHLSISRRKHLVWSVLLIFRA
jgi:hypothetical protein